MYDTTDSSTNSINSINSTNCLSRSKKEIRLEFVNSALDHVQSLSIQGLSVSAIIDSLSASSINRWSSIVSTLPSALACFVRKALQQQLPTFANLQRWNRVSSNMCPLCHSIQTNKHVLNNCSAPIALERFRARHDAMLKILCNWLLSVKNPAAQLFADLGENKDLPSPSKIFRNFRPDIALISNSGTIFVWELTICHETNICHSREFKKNKYAQLSGDLHPAFSTHSITLETIEVSSLGFISDSSCFTLKAVSQVLPITVANDLTRRVISESFNIYKSRNCISDNV